uniref:histone acetyltransferase HAC1-like n=1 Tax=Erigeron canadensis TaxID=72917 RepID=UPI001CB94A2D|nr:histone acetyltransferase HAC1-like [Erigeron canadensis]
MVDELTHQFHNTNNIDFGPIFARNFDNEQSFCINNNVNKYIGNIAKEYMEISEGENWASNLISHLNSQFPTIIDTPKGLQNLIQQDVRDANLYQIASSHSSLPDLLVSPDFRDSESYMNLGYSCYNPASVNIYNPVLYEGSVYNDYSQNVSCGGLNTVSSLGIKQTDLDLITSPEQVSSITACSYGDVISDSEAFDSRPRFSLQQQPFTNSQYGSFTGKKSTYNMDVPLLMVDDVQSSYPESCNMQQHDSLQSKCNTQISHQIQMCVSQQPSVQFHDRFETRSDMLFVNDEKSSKDSENSPHASQYVSWGNSSDIFSLRVLNSYVMYKDMPADLRREVSFQDYMHAEECKPNNICKCHLYVELSSHFDKCSDLKCNICGPARHICGAGNSHLESRKRKKDQSELTLSGDSGRTQTLLDPLPTKYPKLESLTVGNGFLQEYVASLDQHDPNNAHGEQDLTSVNPRDEITNDIMKTYPEVCSGHRSFKEKTSDEKERSDQTIPETMYGPNSAPDANESGINSRPNDEKEKSGQAIVEVKDGLNSAPDGNELGLNLKKSMTPVMSLVYCDSGLESGKTKIKITSSADGLELEPEKIHKIQSVSLADFFTADQIKSHLLSFTSQKDISGKREPSIGQNTCQLCSMDKLVFAPVPIYCSSCELRIKRNVGYYRSANEIGIRYCFCMSCYRGTHGANIMVRGFSFPKSNLQKAKNDEEKEDSWVLCDKCQCWQHRVCGLYNDEKDVEGKAEYICPKCYLEEIESGTRVPLPQTAASSAKDLPRTNLSDHIEQRLSTRLNQEREELAKISGIQPEEVPGAEDLVVRVVVSFEKQLEVRQKFIDILHGEDYPSGFTYRSKLIFLFQKIEGVDVCLFGMCVQEFGSECAGPNQRCVYISYLDSVKYFRPERKSVAGESLRTFVYHEILIGYLEYCKQRGFATCYIWACPLIKGEDYIFYCHPESQRTPKQDKLRQWYKSMLKKASEDNVVVDHTNFYHQFFVPNEETNTKITAARLPYFDGDYWSGAAENIVRKLEIEEKAGGLQSKLPNKRILKSMGQDKHDIAMKDVLVMQKLGQTILPVKENFMIIYLHYTCTGCNQVILSGSRWFCNQCKKIQLCSRCYNVDKKNSGDKIHTCHSGEKNPLSEVVVSDVNLDTKDDDDVLCNIFFETRDAFLNKCQKSHFQFDTLSRAKYSSLMILYHLIHKPVIRPTCTACHADVVVERCWQCNVCVKYYLCELCYKTRRGACHPHKLSSPSMEVVCGSKIRQFQKQKALELKAVMDVLMHASECERIPCPYKECVMMRRLFYHAARCSIRARGGCKFCSRVWKILKEHSRICRDSNCKIPRCRDIKNYKEKLAANSENRQATVEHQPEGPKVPVS